MKTKALKGIIIPLFITTICSIFLVTNSVMAQNNPNKKVTTVRVERARVVDSGNAANKLTAEQKTKIQDLRIEHMIAIQTLKAQNAELTSLIAAVLALSLAACGKQAEAPAPAPVAAPAPAASAPDAASAVAAPAASEPAAAAPAAK